MATSSGGSAFCECGARLRRDKPPGSRCDPCERSGPPRLVLPEDYYDNTDLRTVLASYDFGGLFRRLRADQHLSQHALAQLTGLSQRYVSDVENGRRKMCHIDVVARVTSRLAVPPLLLGFTGPATVGASPGRKDSAMLRRNFVGHAAALTLGMATGLDIDRLLALLPHTEPTGTRHLGAADIDALEQITTQFSRHDFAFGSGLIRQAAIEQMRTVLPLLQHAEIPSHLRPRLMVATGRLAMQAGWLCFDCADHDTARRLWLIGLGIARNTDHPHATDLTAYLLGDMALQAVHLNHPDEALGLARIGETASVGGHPVSAATTCHLKRAQARAHAAEGDTVACQRALGQADDHFTTIDPAATPPWAAFASRDDIHLASQGDAHYALAQREADARAAGRAVASLRDAVHRFGPEYARPRAVRLPGLAGAHALAGDTDTAVAIGHEALDAVAAVSSPRAVDRLRTLHTVLEPMQNSPGVAELRERVVTTAA